jgi:acylphosphatase
MGIMRKRVEVFYTGRVQGVGFRYTTREIAKGFEISGFVQNLEDGRVELAAEGEESEVREFLQAIRTSQLGDHIRSASETWKETTENCKGFVIAH